MKYRVSALALVLILISGMLASCNSVGKNGDETSNTVRQSIGKDAESVMAIRTPLCDIKFPSEWQDTADINVRSGAACVVEFKLKNGAVSVFDIVFNGTEGDRIGALITDNGKVDVRIKSYALDKNSPDYDKLSMMQEDINVIIHYLSEDYDFEVGGYTYQEEDSSVFKISAPFADLYYPKKWINTVSVNSEANSVHFTYGETKLFDIVYGDGEGDTLGTYNGKAIKVVTYDISYGDFYEEEYDKIMEMQEDLNVILQYLMQNGNFILAD